MWTTHQFTTISTTFIDHGIYRCSLSPDRNTCDDLFLQMCFGHSQQSIKRRRFVFAKIYGSLNLLPVSHEIVRKDLISQVPFRFVNERGVKAVSGSEATQSLRRTPASPPRLKRYLKKRCFCRRRWRTNIHPPLEFNAVFNLAASRFNTGHPLAGNF